MRDTCLNLPEHTSARITIENCSVMATLRTCTREVSGSHSGQVNGYHDQSFNGFTGSQGNSKTAPLKRPRSFTSKSLFNHH